MPSTMKGLTRPPRARRKKKKKQLSPIKSEAALAVELIDLSRRDAAGADAVVLQLFAARVDIDATGVLDLGIDVHDVNVEDERLVARRREPVDIVFVVRDGRVFAGGE